MPGRWRCKPNELSPRETLARLGPEMQEDLLRLAGGDDASDEALALAIRVWQRRWEDTPGQKKRNKDPGTTHVWGAWESGYVHYDSLRDI